MAKVTLKRFKQFSSSAVKFKVYLNNNYCGDIRRNEEKEFSIAETIETIRFETAMFVANINTEITDSKYLNLKMNGWSGKLEVSDENGKGIPCITKKSSFQYLYLFIIFIIAFIAGFLLFS